MSHDTGAPSADPVDDLLSFLDASPTPFHAVAECARRLRAAGYRELREEDGWSLAPGDRVFVTRNGSSIAAIELGEGAPQEHGVHLIGAHTDSPNLRVKPNPALKRGGQHQLGVEVYGGALLYTWIDRDLGFAGRVMLREGDRAAPHLVRVHRPLLRVPSLAIHLDRQVNTEGLVLNPQSHMVPATALDSGGPFDLEALLIDALGAHASGADVLAFDLAAYDVTPAARSGARNEYVVSGRLDNLASCHAALSALLAPRDRADRSRGVFFFDHEECGSQSAQGAEGTFLRDTVVRVIESHASASRDVLPRALARSFLVSADMAHAIHPNYVDRHEPQHQPQLGAGPVIKWNVNQRYATDAESAARFELWCERADVAPQKFVVRTDMPCGTTIGPIVAAGLGIKSIDVGSPMLSMHSCRETAGAGDVAKMIAVMRAFLAS